MSKQYHCLAKYKLVWGEPANDERYWELLGKVLFLLRSGAWIYFCSVFCNSLKILDKSRDQPWRSVTLPSYLACRCIYVYILTDSGIRLSPLLSRAKASTRRSSQVLSSEFRRKWEAGGAGEGFLRVAAWLPHIWDYIGNARCDLSAAPRRDGQIKYLAGIKAQSLSTRRF